MKQRADVKSNTQDVSFAKKKYLKDLIKNGGETWEKYIFQTLSGQLTP